MSGGDGVKLRALVLAAGGVLTLRPEIALAEQRFFLDVSAGATASRNPFLQTGDNTGAASAFVQVDPQFEISDEVSEVTFNGSFRFNRYTRLYGNDASAQGGVKIERHLSSATLLRARASAQVARTSALDFITSPGVGLPDENAPPILPDVTFAGTRSRTTVFQADLGLDHDINARERLAIDLAATTTEFSQAGQSDYRFVTSDLDYRRTLSERTSVFAAVRLGYSDFLGSKLDDGVIVAPTIGLSTRLNPRLTLEAGLGASYSRVNDLGGRKDSRLVPSARLILCESIVDSKGCFKVSRGSQPTALSGLTTVTTASVSYSKPISQRDQIYASANYTRSDRPKTLRVGQSSDLLTASATYDRTFNRRFSVYLTPSYARIFDSSVRRRADIAVRVGVRYRLGSEG